MSDFDETVFVNMEMEQVKGTVPKAEEKGTGEKDKLTGLYTELGKAYYEGGFEDPLPELINFFDEITKAKNVKTEKQDQLEQIVETDQIETESKMWCTNCGKALSPGTVFCTQCGTRVQ